MQIRKINAKDATGPAGGGYSQAIEVTGHDKIFSSADRFPSTWKTIFPRGFQRSVDSPGRMSKSQLRAAGMTLDNVVKVTTFLADRCYGMENREVRRSVLGDRCPAWKPTIVVDIFDSKWLVEIEAVAAA